MKKVSCNCLLVTALFDRRASEAARGGEVTGGAFGANGSSGNYLAYLLIRGRL